jgi:Mlc titration factor MtfA (ptsG expression regulator)
MELFIAAIIIFVAIAAVAKLIETGRKKAQDIRQSDAVASWKYGEEFRSSMTTTLMNFSYYSKLSVEGKVKFERLVLLQLSRRKFVGSEGYEPDDRIKIMISATAAQLGFHLDREWLASFDTVLVHPEIFRVREDGPLMKGATSANGIIRISAKDFYEGYKDPGDKLNVGLHEFAHALLLEYSDSALNFDDMYMFMQPFEYVTSDELKEGSDDKGVLRKYAFTNRQEFFAVCVETFFEAPHDFSKEHPELFDIISKLLNQDTRNSHADYVRNAFDRSPASDQS